MKRLSLLACIASLLTGSAYAQTISDGSDMIKKVTQAPVVLAVDIQIEGTKIGGIMSSVVPDDKNAVTLIRRSLPALRSDIYVMRQKSTYLVFGTVWFGKPSMHDENGKPKFPVPVTFSDSFVIDSSHTSHELKIKSTPVSIDFDPIGGFDKFVSKRKIQVPTPTSDEED